MKKKLTGTNKHGPPISRTVVSPGDDPKHELVLLEIGRQTTTSPDPDWNETEQDDFVILYVNKGQEVHAAMKWMMEKLGLKVNEDKTRLCRFDYTQLDEVAG